MRQSWHVAVTLAVQCAWCCAGKLQRGACPGQIRFPGYGNVSIVPTGWGTLKEGEGEVTLRGGNQITPHMGSRVYFADNCTAGKYDHKQYLAMNLLGKTLRYTTNMSGAGCGCNAALYLTSLRQSTRPSECLDYYCDANSVCGESCAEIDIQEGNQYSWHSTLHTLEDHSGLGSGYGGGGSGWNGPRDWSPADYGPGAKCIDTTAPFQVAVSFPTDASGALAAMSVKLSQEGSPCPLSISIGNYAGMAELSRALQAGMTPIVSYWKSDDMLWMDGAGMDQQGPCFQDEPETCPDTVSFYDFSVADIGEEPPEDTAVAVDDSRGSVVEQHGALAVHGNKIVGRHGRPVRLRGVSLFWSQWMDQFWNEDAVRWVRDDWHATLVRAAMGVEMEGFLQNPAAETRKIEAVVQACIRLGIYVVIDWHDHHANTHLSQASAFFTKMAKKYGKYPNVMFEVFNEPMQVGWLDAIRPYHQAIVKVIRKYSDNLIILGTREWSQDVDEASNDPVAGENLAYTIHFYAATHGQYLRDKVGVALQRGRAVFATEWGTCEASGNGRLALDEAQAWLDFLEENHISDANWAISDKAESCSALAEGASGSGGWGASDLTESGTFVRASLRESNPRPWTGEEVSWTGETSEHRTNWVTIVLCIGVVVLLGVILGGCCGVILYGLRRIRGRPGTASAAGAATASLRATPSSTGLLNLTQEI